MSTSRPTTPWKRRSGRVVGIAVSVSAFIIPIALQVDNASAANFISCDHPSVRVSVHPPLGLFPRNGAARPAHLKVSTLATTQDLFCSSGFSIVKHGSVRTIEQARLRLVLARSTNDCGGLTGPGAGGTWQGKVTIIYKDENGGRVAITRRTGTFHVLDHATSFEGPGVVQISASPKDAPATGPFAGTNLEIKVLYDPSAPPYTDCLAGGGWRGTRAPTAIYWEEF